MNINNNAFQADESSFEEILRDKTLYNLLSEIEIFFKIHGISDYKEKEGLLKKVKDAFFVTERMHHGQKRDSGEDYIQHMIRVAINMLKKGGKNIPTELFFEAIQVALLHDIKEDTNFGSNKLNHYFGAIVEKTVSFLSKEPWQNFSKDKKEGKRLRDIKYFAILQLLKDCNFEKLEMQNFTHEEQQSIKIIVLIVKGFDRVDNHDTMHSQTIKQVEKKVLETHQEIIPLLEEHPTLTEILKKQIKNLIKNRLDSKYSLLI